MIRVCYYRGCGVVYGEKEPISDEGVTYGLCPKHLVVSQRELEAEIDSYKRGKSCVRRGGQRADKGKQK
jgi:hypothetical protein